jgi:hypothetical protein
MQIICANPGGFRDYRRNKTHGNGFDAHRVERSEAGSRVIAGQLARRLVLRGPAALGESDPERFSQAARSLESFAPFRTVRHGAGTFQRGEGVRLQIMIEPLDRLLFGHWRSTEPDDKSNDHKNSESENRGERAGHPHPHRDLQQGQVVGHAGGRTPRVKRSSSAEIRGSETILVSMKQHFGHSNRRFSEPPGRDEMLLKSIRMRQRVQSGRSIGVSRWSVNEIMGSSQHL